MARWLAQPMAQADLAGQLFVRDVELGHEVKLQADPRFEAFLNRPFPEALDFAVRRGLLTEEGLADLLRQYRQTGEQAADRVLQEMQRRTEAALQAAIRDGQSLEGFTEAVEADTQSLGLGTRDRSYLETVFRTNVQSAYGAGRFTQMTHPDVMAARPFVQYLTVNDSRVRPEHAALHGDVFRSDSPEWHRIAPPNGYNCFLPGTTISGRVEIGSRGLYTGQAVEVRTESGRVLRVTPNHPVATVNGFAPAGSLENGQELLSYGVDIQVHAVGEVDVNQAPALVEDVFSALAERGEVLRTGLVADDLHGDAKAMGSHVDVVGAERVLTRWLDPPAEHESSDLALTVPYSGAAQVVGYRGLALGLVGDDPTTGRGPGGGALPLDSSAVHLRPLQTLRLGPAAELDTDLTEHPGERRAAHARRVGQMLHGCAGLVFTDKVVEVREFDFAGHVYDFQSPLGWIVAEGVVTSNCRCSMVTRKAEEVDTSRVVVQVPTEIDGVRPGADDPRFDQSPIAQVS